MSNQNQTVVKEFIFVGFPQEMSTCALFFTLLLLMYIVTILANLFVIGTVILSSKLHLPMYFFLCNLSFIDVCFSSANLPTAMAYVFFREKTISVIGCKVQMNLGLFLGGAESFLLAVMAYDRYVAICFPLRYITIINWNTCRIITVVLWSGSFFVLNILTNLKPVVFCKENKLDHFVCEMVAVLDLACENGNFLKQSLFIICLHSLLMPSLFILMSYILIISSILKIRSTDSRQKAFSTCASHLSVVFMYYGASISIYIGQVNILPSNMKYFSIVYGIITPALNPLIYTLRNKDVKNSFQGIVTKYSTNVIT